MVIAGYIYVSPPVRSELSITAEDHEAPFTGLMILCPSKARELGLCTPGERGLHAKYRLAVQPPPPPEVSLRLECKVFEKAKYSPFDNPLFPGWRDWPFEILTGWLMDATSNFNCSYTRTGEGTFELDLAFIASPDDVQLVASYLLVVTIRYDEPLLPFGLLTRNVNATDVGDLCLLGYNLGKHPRPDTPESKKLIGEFSSCDEAVLWQRELLHIPPPPRPRSRVDSRLLRVLPTIDGFMDPGEWSDAGKLSLSGGRVDLALYAKNDNNFLYVAVDVTPSQQAVASSRFEVRLYFDVDHDSAWIGGRDVVYVYSSNPSYSGFIRYSEECRPNFLSLGVLSLGGDYNGGYSKLAPCLTPLNEPGAMQGRYHEQPAGHWVVEMKIPLRGEGGIMTEPGQVVGMDIGIWGGAESYKDPSFYGRLPTQFIDLALASG
jgi:hypothetical protein